MTPLVDRTGKRYGSLLAIRRGEDAACKLVQWVCICDCGNVTEVLGVHLQTGRTTSCGCKQRTWGHGYSRTLLYGSWRNMHCRTRFRDSYQGRKVAPEWSSFTAFRIWAEAHGYEPGLELDRIDNDGDYTPDNCQWLTPEAHQAKHR